LGCSWSNETNCWFQQRSKITWNTLKYRLSQQTSLELTIWCYKFIKNRLSWSATEYHECS
jgi:hypothetical protein